MFFDICHERDVHYDIVTDAGRHVCKVCGRKWYPRIPDVPRVGEKLLETRWVEGWSWERLLYGRKRV
jgi:hypothetical protein